MLENDNITDVFSKETTYAGSPKLTVSFLILQLKDLANRRLLQYHDQQEQSGNKGVTLRQYKSILRVLAKELRARMIERPKYLNVDFNELIETDPERAHDVLNDYLENDLKLTKIDTRKEYNLNRWSESIDAQSG